jgi:hypothetical protein
MTPVFSHPKMHQILAWFNSEMLNHLPLPHVGSVSRSQQ